MREEVGDEGGFSGVYLVCRVVKLCSMFKFNMTIAPSPPPPRPFLLLLYPYYGGTTPL